MKEGRLKPLDFAISSGVIVGGVVFLITMLSIMGYMRGFPLMILLFKDLYGTIGYDRTLLGAVLGALYAFMDAFILTFLFAWIYNKLLRRKN